MNYQRRLFVGFFLGPSKGNATDAARRAKFRNAKQMAYDLLKDEEVQAEIQAALDAQGMASDEILARLTDMASVNMLDFISLKEDGTWDVDLAKAEAKGLGHCIKRLSYSKLGPTIELHDPIPALTLLGKFRRLFVDRLELRTDIDLSKLSIEQLRTLADTGKLPSSDYQAGYTIETHALPAPTSPDDTDPTVTR